jgi:hypothetical protein
LHSFSWAFFLWASYGFVCLLIDFFFSRPHYFLRALLNDQNILHFLESGHRCIVDREWPIFMNQIQHLQPPRPRV